MIHTRTVPKRLEYSLVGQIEDIRGCAERLKCSAWAWETQNELSCPTRVNLEAIRSANKDVVIVELDVLTVSVFIVGVGVICNSH